MLKTLRNAFKIKDVRNRILFTFMMLIVIRIGSELPIPGVKGSVFQSWLNSKSAALRLLFLCPKRAYGVKLRTEKTSRQAINGGNHNGRNKHNRNRNQQG